jgi:hypothetical protein
MPNLHIFQIYYSSETQARLDPGFLALDNMSNQRPDWREYWPIRKYLLAATLGDDDYYGFLSPSFAAKTRLSSSVVIDFVRAQGGTPDVIFFSPFFDQLAFYLSQWEQGIMAHRSMSAAFDQCLALVAPQFSIKRSLSTSRNSGFCNYFVAKGRFWRHWLDCCERLFNCAERADSELGRMLSLEVAYKTGAAPTKVFMIERIASALLATQPHWIVKAFNSMLLPYSQSPISALGADLAALDALKIAYLSEPHEQYRQAFLALRARLADTLRAHGPVQP